MESSERVAAFSPSSHIAVDEFILRPYVRDDARELMEAVTESVEHLRPWMPWIQFEPQDIHGKRKLIKEFTSEWEARTGFAMGIFFGLRLVGATGFHVRGPYDSLEIGYWVRVGHTRQHIALRATRALVDEAFRLPGIQRVFVNHDVANVASGGVPKRLGFQLFDTVKREPMSPGDSGMVHQWVMTKEEWQIKQLVR